MLHRFWLETVCGVNLLLATLGLQCLCSIAEDPSEAAQAWITATATRTAMKSPGNLFLLA